MNEGETWQCLTFLQTRRRGDKRILARCKCGKVKTFDIERLLSGRTLSCGCLKGNVLSHGMSRTPMYRAWQGMHTRCYNANHISYSYYGGRGIKVCEKWRGPGGFENFLADMGMRPEGLTLDRIDPDGDYEPSNCRWATHAEQAQNRRPRASKVRSAVIDSIRIG